MTTVSTMPTVRKLRLDGFVMGPVPCQSCRSLVWFGRSLTRVQGQTVMGEVLAWRDWRAYRVHRCPLASRVKMAGAQESGGSRVTDVKEPELFDAYRNVSGKGYSTPCANCEGLIQSEKGDEAAVAHAVDEHRRSLVHKAWTSWRQALAEERERHA